MSHNLEPWDYDNTIDAAAYYEVEYEDAIAINDTDRAEFCRLMRLDALKRLGMISLDEYYMERRD